MAKAIAVVDEQNTGMQRFKEQPEKLMGFLNDVRSEMRKVVSPSREEVQATTLIVLITVFIFAAYFFVIDYIASHTLDVWLLHLTKR